MLQFLNPIWLLAVGAIIIPLAIHLWNVKKGKTLKIGSIRLLGESSKQTSRSLRLQDLWLLLLRCMLLIILALLLAAPMFASKEPAEKIKGWILLDKNDLREAYRAFKPGIDSLTKLGYETRYFNPRFAKFNLADTADTEEASWRDTISPVSYWSLARALDDTLPANASAYIFTSNRLNRFTGTRPLLRSKINWKTYDTEDSVYTKIAGAYLTSRDSLRVILAQSTPGSITYSASNTSLSDPDPAYRLAEPRGTAIRLNSGGDLQNVMDSSFAQIDTSEMHVALYTDKYPADMAYVKAALEAVQSFSRRRITIGTYRDAGKLPASADWLFWLSESPVEENVKTKAHNIFSYQPGKTVSADKCFITAGGNRFFDLKNIELYKRKSIDKASTEEEFLLEDISGHPLLTRSDNGKYSEFRFYSHLDPEWTDLVWHPRFPEILLDLVFDREQYSQRNRDDRRILPLAQIIPARLNETAAIEEPQLKETKLDKPLWILFVLLLASERWAAHKKRSMNANG